MYIPAITIGYAVPIGNFDASIHSVFHSALNLRPVDGDGLLTLVLSREPDLPQGIRLDSPEGFSFEKFQVGESVTCRVGILHFENTRLSIQLGNARRWERDLSKLEIDTTDPAVSAAWSLVWNTLNRRQKQRSAEIVGEDLFRPNAMVRSGVSRTAGRAIRELVDATRRCDPAGISTVQILIGLGSGLTPSGDDFLIGYISGLWCTTRGKNDRTQFTTELGKRIVCLSGGTNDISRTYLFHAAHGQVSSRLTALAEAISRGEEGDRILGRAEAAMETGNTSGMDAVTGLLVGISAWNTSDDTNPNGYPYISGTWS